MKRVPWRLGPLAVRVARAAAMGAQAVPMAETMADFGARMATDHEGAIGEEVVVAMVAVRVVMVIAVTDVSPKTDKHAVLSATREH